MARERFGNNAQTTLNGAITSGQTTLTLTTATNFPAPDFRILIDSEIILVGGRTGTACSVLTRGAEGTTAAGHATGATVTCVLTAASLDGLVPMTTRGDVTRAGADGDPERLALGTVGQILRSDGTDAAWADHLTDLVYIIDGGGVAITTGVKGDISPNFSGVITGWRVLADVSGSIVVDIWKDTYANYPPTVADTITGATKPTLSGAVKNENMALAWGFVAGDTFRFNVDSVTTCTRVTLILRSRRTS